MCVSFFQTVLNEVIQHRNQKSDTFIATEGAIVLNLEYLPWTAANGEEGVADALLLQVFIFFSENHTQWCFFYGGSTYEFKSQ